MFRRNVGGFDRAARVVAGGVLLAIGVGIWPQRPGPGLGIAIVGALGLATGALRFCPPYLLFGFSTARCDPQATESGAGPPPKQRRLLRRLGIGAGGVAFLALLVGIAVTALILSRPPLGTIRSTTHASLTRADCLHCHAPVAEEWRRSFHHRSLTGPYWRDVRELGYQRLLDRFRKRCVDCHAPANVLDLPEVAPDPAASDERLGVECTPNLLREPRGTIPAARSDEVELGVDCTACHVGKAGIVGSGRLPASAHATFADPRFGDPARVVTELCRTCHRATVDAWQRTSLAAAGTTCLDCHMPAIDAPAVAGGPNRPRHHHGFPADKDPEMLARAMNASLTVTADRQARLRIVNDRVGHDLPSGGNFLVIDFSARDAGGRLLAERRALIGRDEGLLLDFWPFASDSRIAYGEQRDLLFDLPSGHGEVRAIVRYHDWMKVNPVVATLQESY
jgi:hypothetical protein